MAVDPNNKHPSFSNLLEQGFINKIRLPAAFVKEHKKMLAKTALLRTDEGMSWEAKIVREASDYFICEGDWPWFVVYNKLELGDMLIFYLVEKSTFHVLPYSKKPHINIRHFEELSSSENEVENVEEKDDEDENIEASRKSKKVKTEPKESSAHGTRSTESDDDSTEILDGTPTSNRGNTKFSDMVVHSVENLGHCPLGQSSKMKRQEGDTEDDVSLDIHIKRMEIEKLLEGIAEDQLTIEDEGFKMQSQQSSVIYDVRRTVMDKEKAIAYQRAKANFNSKNPFFISFMHHSYISRSSNHLCIKLRFARTYIPENCSNIMLRVAGRGSWPVTYYKGPTQAKIGIGWGAFVLDNQLKLGDICVFEVIKGTQIFMDVTIFRTARSTPMQETDGPDCS
ncbi:hypothetical protein KY289_014055 [Solanum tuberosum]|nr:hypothetical protein KY289_014055 [Solanum tuberosum]